MCDNLPSYVRHGDIAWQSVNTKNERGATHHAHSSGVVVPQYEGKSCMVLGHRQQPMTQQPMPRPLPEEELEKDDEHLDLMQCLGPFSSRRSKEAVTIKMLGSVLSSFREEIDRKLQDLETRVASRAAATVLGDADGLRGILEKTSTDVRALQDEVELMRNVLAEVAQARIPRPVEQMSAELRDLRDSMANVRNVLDARTCSAETQSFLVGVPRELRELGEEVGDVRLKVRELEDEVGGLRRLCTDRDSESSPEMAAELRGLQDSVADIRRVLEDRDRLAQVYNQVPPSSKTVPPSSSTRSASSPPVPPRRGHENHGSSTSGFVCTWFYFRNFSLS